MHEPGGNDPIVFLSEDDSPGSATSADRRSRRPWLGAGAITAMVVAIVVATTSAGQLDPDPPAPPTTVVEPTPETTTTEAAPGDSGPWTPADEAWLAPRRPAETPELALEAAAVQFLGWAIDAEQIDATTWRVHDRDSDHTVSATVARRTAGWVVTRLGEAPDSTGSPDSIRIDLTSLGDEVAWRGLHIDAAHGDDVDAASIVLPLQAGAPRPDLVAWSLADGRVTDIVMFLFDSPDEDPLEVQRFGSDRLAPNRLRTTVAPVAGQAADGTEVSRFVIDFADGSRWWMELPARVDGALGVEHSTISASMIGNGVGLALEAEQGCFDGAPTSGGVLVERDPADSERFLACLPEYGVRLTGTLDGLTDADLTAIGLSPVRLGPNTRQAIESYQTFLGAAELGPNPIGPVELRNIVATVDVLAERLVARNLPDGEIAWTHELGDARIRRLSSGTIILVGRSGVEAVDLAGAVVWRIDRPEDFELTAVPELPDGDVLIVEHDPGEGGRAAPRVERVDPSTGAVQWLVEFRIGTDWQWVDPLVLDDIVVVMDVPNEPVEDLEAMLWAIDLDDGSVRWRVPLANRSEVFRTDLLLAHSADGAVIAENVGNTTFAIDATTGRLRWSVRSGPGIRLVDEPEGQVLIDQGGGIDLETGERFALG